MFSIWGRSSWIAERVGLSAVGRPFYIQCPESRVTKDSASVGVGPENPEKRACCEHEAGGSGFDEERLEVQVR